MRNREVKCKICEASWNPRCGTVLDFIKKHMELHGIPQPKTFDEAELVRRRVFEDTNLEEDWEN